METNKLWYCPDEKCKWYKVYMTPEDNWEHMIKIHNMTPPAGHEPAIKPKSKKKLKKKKRKR